MLMQRYIIFQRSLMLHSIFNCFNGQEKYNLLDIGMLFSNVEI